MLVKVTRGRKRCKRPPHGWTRVLQRVPNRGGQNQIPFPVETRHHPTFSPVKRRRVDRHDAGVVSIYHDAVTGDEMLSVSPRTSSTATRSFTDASGDANRPAGFPTTLNSVTPRGTAKFFSRTGHRGFDEMDPRPKRIIDHRHDDA